MTELSLVGAGRRGYTEEASQAGPEGGNVMWGQQSHFCLKPVSSIGLSPVPLGGTPVLAMAVLFSGLFLQTIHVTGYSQPENRLSTFSPHTAPLFPCPPPSSFYHCCLLAGHWSLTFLSLCITLQTSLFYSALSSHSPTMTASAR